jgi:hypothetical protein
MSVDLVAKRDELEECTLILGRDDLNHGLFLVEFD